jgi:RNA polymerase sigma factor FliA
VATRKMRPETASFDEEMLWKRFREHSDIVARSLLVEKYSPLVKTLAATLFAKRHDDEVEFDDFFQFGMVGLIESIDRYEPEKGAAFKTFASYRIRGAILNGLEKTTERHEQYAFRARLRKERIESITSVDGKEQKDDLFEEMVEVALGLAICYMLEDTGLVQDTSGTNNNQAYDSNEMFIVKTRLIETIADLPDRQRSIIAQHYFEGISFNDIAKSMSVTKGRVSQIHKQALQMLRDKLGGNLSLDEFF